MRRPSISFSRMRTSLWYFSCSAGNSNTCSQWVGWGWGEGWEGFGLGLGWGVTNRASGAWRLDGAPSLHLHARPPAPRLAWLMRWLALRSADPISTWYGLFRNSRASVCGGEEGCMWGGEMMEQ